MPKGTGRPLTRGDKNILKAMKKNPKAAKNYSTLGGSVSDTKSFGRMKRAESDKYKASKIKNTTLRKGGTGGPRRKKK